ncbi:Cullin [Theobroma cacao]|nr:Cullin [Theobroma cacao]
MAKENQTSFGEYLARNPALNPGIDLSVSFLTAGFWPCYKGFDLNLPAEMVKCIEGFEQFYQRKLTWVYSLGTCYLTAKFEHKTMELIVAITAILKSRPSLTWKMMTWLGCSILFHAPSTRFLIPLPQTEERKLDTEDVVGKDRSVGRQHSNFAYTAGVWDTSS